MAADPFWTTKALDQLTPEEWESLCDGCGKCCLIKLEGEDGTIEYTDVACRLFDGTTCGCTDYPNRKARVPDCVLLTPENIRQLRFMPPSCAYRLVGEGKPLPWWHHLVSGSRDTVHIAGMSARDRTIPEDEVPDEELEDRIVRWPARRP